MQSPGHLLHFTSLQHVVQANGRLVPDGQQYGQAGMEARRWLMAFGPSAIRGMGLQIGQGVWSIAASSRHGELKRRLGPRAATMTVDVTLSDLIERSTP